MFNDRMVFILNRDCFLVKGIKEGAIYNLTTGDIYSIDADSVDILDKCENRIPVNQILQKMLSKIDPKEILDYFKELKSLNLGDFSSKYRIVDKVTLKQPRKKLDFIWLELTRKCNLKCLHCYANSGLEVNRIAKNDLLNLNQWERIIQEAFDAGCKKLQFIGGEPLLMGKGLYPLIELTEELGYELVEIFTNATMFIEESINFLAKHNVQVAISIYSKNPEIHDKITTQKGSFQKTIKNLHRLQDSGVKIRLATVVMKQNEDYVEETLNFLEELVGSKSQRSFDIIRSVGRGSKTEISTDKFNSCKLKKEPVFFKITREEFIRNKNGHSCWQGKLCIVSDGSVIPCIMAREEICGNIKNQSLEDVISGNNLQNLWNLSKDHIEICQDCEFRYACFDCRSMIKGETGSLYARGDNCSYDPYQGEWGYCRGKEVSVC